MKSEDYRLTIKGFSIPARAGSGEPEDGAVIPLGGPIEVADWENDADEAEYRKVGWFQAYLIVGDDQHTACDAYSQELTDAVAEVLDVDGCARATAQLEAMRDRAQEIAIAAPICNALGCRELSRAAPPPLPECVREVCAAITGDIERKSNDGEANRIYHALTSGKDVTRLSRQAWGTLRWLATESDIATVAAPPRIPRRACTTPTGSSLQSPPCPDCNETGYVVVPKPVHATDETGQCASWCEACGPQCRHGCNSLECDACKSAAIAAPSGDVDDPTEEA